ncbi:MAG TPA: hypothetical protein VK807_06315 [Gemmatimonadaceae bacterium]|nr:hypothetical protein [Gemmatimonadaceae bacterium]
MESSKQPGPSSLFWLRRPLLTVWLFALVTQTVSVRWLVGHYVEPNAAPYVGRMLAATGRLELTDWSRLKGGTRPSDPPLRAFELPLEPLWVAAGTRTGGRVGVNVWDYWNVPVAALLIVSIAAVGLAIGGPMVALIAGFVAALDPVTLLHASNRDDAVLGSALLWGVFAIIALRWRGWGYVPLFIAAGAAAITRMEAVLLIVPLLALRPIRRAAAIAVAGVVVALGAWGGRNQVVLGHVVIGSTHDGITLWESNGPFARRSLALGQVDIVSMDKTVMAPIFAETQDLDEVGADGYFKRQALRYMASHPLDVVRTAAAKVAVSIASIHPNLPLSAPRNLAAMLDNALLLILAGIGLARFARSPMATTAQFGDISKHIMAQYSDTPKHIAAQYGDTSKQSDEREARGVSYVFAGMCLVTIALLALGPAGMRYWLTLRGALWILAAVSISGRLIPRTVSSSAPAHP